MADNAKELRGQGGGELEKQLQDLRDEQFNLRFQHATGQLENTSRIRQVRRAIARIKTVMNEKRKAAE
ncbi:50S ribosomal protein L29 [Thiohalorhabdus sp.]|uniref:50S ribosomal protein L29 n=1 Tax=Thiohalorhabdus sp. TaxID=3094134 RepID=UPI002FC293DA